MKTQEDDEILKTEVRDYWNEHPCGTQFTDFDWGSKEFFDEVERFRYASQPFMDPLIGFDAFRGKKLLEIGCGLGTDLLQFARGGAIVTGVDLTPRSIELVKRRFALYRLPVEAHVADAEHLPFADGSFDIVYSFGVLHHTPNTQQAIGEVHRVLARGGSAIIMLYHKNSLHYALGTPLHALHRLSKLQRQSVGEDWVRIYDGANNPLGKAYSKKELRSMFSSFDNLSFTLCDPIRRNVPSWFNKLNQRVLAKHTGFWIVIKGNK